MRSAKTRFRGDPGRGRPARVGDGTGRERGGNGPVAIRPDGNAGRAKPMLMNILMGNFGIRCPHGGAAASSVCARTINSVDVLFNRTADGASGSPEITRRTLITFQRPRSGNARPFCRRRVRRVPSRPADGPSAGTRPGPYGTWSGRKGTS